LWKDFEKHFNETHPGFYRVLTDRYPSLTASEIRLCAFLKLHLNTKEIAMITQKSVHSLETMRSRIRQKMNIKRDASITWVLSHL
jgi:DNA-binding CsgD family transcriptional regulator